MSRQEVGSAVPDIQILRGRGSRVRRGVLALEPEGGRSLPLAPEEVPWRSWSGVRQILAGMLEEVGEATILQVLERHPAAARLVLDRWTPPEDADGKAGATAMAARLDSHLTHNWAVQRAAIDSWASLLYDLLEGRQLCLRIPSLHQVDWESLAAIRGLFNRLQGCWPRLVVGFCQELNEPEFDTRGICWRDLPIHVVKSTRSLAALPGARSLEVGELAQGGASPQITPPQTLPSLFEGVEDPCRRLLEGVGPLKEEACRQVVEAMEACFRRYSFCTSLWLGCELFRRMPKYSGARAARAHAIVALSAHNRQFRSEGNVALGRFIAGHLEAALAEEGDPAVRCALFYRLAVAYGRRLGELETAHRWARKGIVEALALGGAEGRYQHIWVNNILAYIQGRQKDAEGARDSMLSALELACDPAYPLWEEGKDSPSRFGDLALSRSLVAHNLAVTESLCGDQEQATARLEESCRLEDVIEGSAKYWAQNLVRNLRIRNRPDRALLCGEVGLRAASESRDAPLELFFRLQLGDVTFRLGDAEASVEHYLAADRLASKMGPFYDQLPDWDFPMEAALTEAGHWEVAQQRMRRKVEGAGAPVEVVAEAAARLAIHAAMAGDGEGAERWSECASDAAMKGGQRHRLLRTAIPLARAAKILGRTEEAASLLQWGLQLYELRQDPQSVAPADALALLVELERSAALPARWADHCFELIPGALSSPLTWWLAPDLLRLWLRVDTGDGDRAVARADSARVLLDIGQQRKDCLPFLPEVRECLQRFEPKGATSAVA